MQYCAKFDIGWANHLTRGTVNLNIYLFRSTFAVDGAKMKVNKDVQNAIESFHAAKKPIGSVTY